MDLTNINWRKSTRSNATGGDCVEVADSLSGVVGLRDSKDPHGPVLLLPRAAFAAFVEFAKQH